MATKTTDPAAQLEKFVKALTKAREEAEEIGARLRTQQARYREVEAALAALARSEPRQFNADGSARGEEARKLQSERSELQASRLPDVHAGAQGRVREREEAVTGCRTEHAEFFARRAYEAGVKDIAELRRLAAEMEAVFVRLDARSGELIGICAATQGLDGQDVADDPQLAVARKAISGLAEAQPPRSMSVTPLTGQEALHRYRVRSGGFVRSPHPDDLGGVEQPLPVERI